LLRETTWKSDIRSENGGREGGGDCGLAPSEIDRVEREAGHGEPLPWRRLGLAVDAHVARARERYPAPVRGVGDRRDVGEGKSTDFGDGDTTPVVHREPGARVCDKDLLRRRLTYRLPPAGK
jgi:hypothetical protein